MKNGFSKVDGLTAFFSFVLAISIAVFAIGFRPFLLIAFILSISLFFVIYSKKVCKSCDKNCPFNSNLVFWKNLFSSQKEYTITKVRSEGLTYVDKHVLLHFNIQSIKGGYWVYLPPSFGCNFEKYLLTNRDKDVVLPRVEEYLKKNFFFGFFADRCKVEFREE